MHEKISNCFRRCTWRDVRMARIGPLQRGHAPPACTIRRAHSKQRTWERPAFQILIADCYCAYLWFKSDKKLQSVCLKDLMPCSQFIIVYYYGIWKELNSLRNTYKFEKLKWILKHTCRTFQADTTALVSLITDTEAAKVQKYLTHCPRYLRTPASMWRNSPWPLISWTIPTEVT